MSRTAIRRVVHVASGALLLPILSAPPTAARVVIMAAAVVAVALDGARVRSPAVHDILSRAVPVFRPAERHRLSGGSWLLIGYAVAALLPAHAAVAGILVGALADPVAASVGERFGGGRAKSWPGFAAALAMGWGGLSVLGLPVPVVIAAGAVGAACERWAVAVDDNLVVAPAVGATVALLT